MKKKWTKAEISSDVMLYVFGSELRMIDESINSLEDLEARIDSIYDKEEILSLTLRTY